jgi:hypothetical protein
MTAFPVDPSRQEKASRFGENFDALYRELNIGPKTNKIDALKSAIVTIDGIQGNPATALDDDTLLNHQFPANAAIRYQRKMVALQTILAKRVDYKGANWLPDIAKAAAIYLHRVKNKSQ